MKFFQKYSDQEILASIQKGQDEKPLTYLYKNVLPKVISYITKNKGSEEEAKDIFQDAVIRFYKHVKDGKFEEKCSVSTFIIGISKNLWLNFIKKKERQFGSLESEVLKDDINLLEDIITKEKTEAVNDLLKQLGEGCEQLLKLSVYENRSMTEICEQLGYSNENVAKTYNYRCKQKLIQLINNNEQYLNLLKR